MKPGKDQNKEKEIEKMMNQQQQKKDRLGDLYGDLFGGISANPSDPVKGTEELAGFLDQYRTSEEEALKNATDALREAREMLTGLTSDLLGGMEKEPEKKKPESCSPPASSADPAKKEEKSAKELPDPMEELDNLIGLTTIKKDVKELADFVTIQKMRKDQGMKSVPVSLHLVFTGNPGTGKTTVARILSRIYQKIGVLSKGQLVEVDRSGLVAGYVGQTALKTQERIKEAMGGILFIDEAYSLAQKDDAFGQEAIDTILKAMEDHRDDLVVIVAGYTGPMEKFINSNPGLKSRFNKYIEFPDYTLDELEAIFNLNCKKYDYHPDEDAARQIRELLKLRMLTRKENFANAREVRNLFEEIITNQARRIALIENPTHDQITTILVEDLYEAAPPAGESPEDNGSGGNAPSAEKKPSAESTPAPEDHPSTESTPAPEDHPSTESTPAPEDHPSTESAPAPEEES